MRVTGSFSSVGLDVATPDRPATSETCATSDPLSATPPDEKPAGATADTADLADAKTVRAGARAAIDGVHSLSGRERIREQAPFYPDFYSEMILGNMGFEPAITPEASENPQTVRSYFRQAGAYMANNQERYSGLPSIDLKVTRHDNGYKISLVFDSEQAGSESGKESGIAYNEVAPTAAEIPMLVYKLMKGYGTALSNPSHEPVFAAPPVGRIEPVVSSMAQSVRPTEGVTPGAE